MRDPPSVQVGGEGGNRKGPKNKRQEMKMTWTEEDREISSSPAVHVVVFFLVMPHGLWDLSSPTRAQTRAPCSESVES